MLICSFLMSNSVEHNFMFVFVTSVSCLAKCLLTSFAHLKKMQLWFSHRWEFFMSPEYISAPPSFLCPWRWASVGGKWKCQSLLLL